MKLSLLADKKILALILHVSFSPLRCSGDKCPPISSVFVIVRLLDISPAAGLSFVVDTTGSMGEEINAAKSQARKIIDSRRGTLQEPDFYLLVPFNDPGEMKVEKVEGFIMCLSYGFLMAQWPQSSFGSPKC